jgi:hypothetical protein
MSESIESLRKIFNEHPAGRAATKPLRRGTQVGLSIHGDEQPYHFERTADGATIVAGAGTKTDFDLILGAKAVEAICETQGDSVGDFGVSFLKSLLREADDERVQVKLHAGLIALTRNGYLKVLAMGGPKVLGFLSKEGYIGPRGIAKAIRRLRSN